MDHCIGKTTLLIITISSILILTNARDIHVVQRDLSSFCQKTTNPTLCTETIQAHFHNRAIDPLQALEVEVEATQKQTKKAVGDINTLLSKQDITKSLKSSLGTCKSQYSSILDAIKETKNAIAQTDVVTAKFKFSAVLSFQAACKDEFQGSSFPLSQDSDAIFNLGGNCLDIIAEYLEKNLPPQPVPQQAPPSPYGDVIGTVS